MSPYLILFGVIGILMMLVSPVLIVYFLKHKEYEAGALVALVGEAIGFCMVVAWLGA